MNTKFLRHQKYNYSCFAYASSLRKQSPILHDVLSVFSFASHFPYFVTASIQIVRGRPLLLFPAGFVTIISSDILLSVCIPHFFLRSQLEAPTKAFLFYLFLAMSTLVLYTIICMNFISAAIILLFLSWPGFPHYMRERLNKSFCLVLCRSLFLSDILSYCLSRSTHYKK